MDEHLALPIRRTNRQCNASRTSSPSSAPHLQVTCAAMHRLSSFVLASLIGIAVVFPAHTTGAAAPPPVQRLVLQPSARTIFTIEGIYPRKRGVCEFKQQKPL